jgi:hypothetical protein
MDIALGLRSFGELLAFPVRGEKWAEKMLIGSGLILLAFVVPIVPLIFIYGYAIRIMLRAISGESLDLPAWREWDKLASFGARALVIGLIFSLPAMVVMLGGFGLYMLSTLSMAAAESGGSWPFGLFFLGMGAWMISIPVGSLLMVLAAVILPPSLAHFAVNDRFSAAFAFKQWWPLLSANKLGYLVSWVFLMGVFALAYWAIAMLGYTFFLCWLVPFLMAPLSYYVSVLGAGLFGECYRGGMIARYS